MYACQGNILENDEADEDVEAKITEGIHLKGLTKGDVKLVYMNKQNYTKIPQGIVSFFNNLEALMFMNSKLVNISSDDFKGYSQIKFLSLFGNKIKNLDSEVFDYLPNLIYLNVGWNEIKHVGSKLLVNNPKLKTIIFQFNHCFKEDIENASENELEEFRKKIWASCMPSRRMLENEEKNKKRHSQRSLFDFTKNLMKKLDFR